MEYTVEYLEDKKIVQVKVKGRVNYQLAQQYSMEARKLAHEYNCKKYLINHSKLHLKPIYTKYTLMEMHLKSLDLRAQIK